MGSFISFLIKRDNGEIHPIFLNHQHVFFAQPYCVFLYMRQKKIWNYWIMNWGDFPQQKSMQWLFFTVKYIYKDIEENNWTFISVLGDSFNEATLLFFLYLNGFHKSHRVGALLSRSNTVYIPVLNHVNIYLKSYGCVMYRLSAALKLSRHLHQSDIRTTDETHSNPRSWIRCRIAFHEHPHKHI